MKKYLILGIAGVLAYFIVFKKDKTVKGKKLDDFKNDDDTVDSSGDGTAEANETATIETEDGTIETGGEQLTDMDMGFAVGNARLLAGSQQYQSGLSTQNDATARIINDTQIFSNKHE